MEFCVIVAITSIRRDGKTTVTIVACEQAFRDDAVSWLYHVNRPLGMMLLDGQRTVNRPLGMMLLDGCTV